MLQYRLKCFNFSLVLLYPFSTTFERLLSRSTVLLPCQGPFSIVHLWALLSKWEQETSTVLLTSIMQFLTEVLTQVRNVGFLSNMVCFSAIWASYTPGTVARSLYNLISCYETFNFIYYILGANLSYVYILYTVYKCSLFRFKGMRTHRIVSMEYLFGRPIIASEMNWD